MAQGLTWELILKDSFSPAAKKAETALAKLEKAFDDFGKKTHNLTDEQLKWNDAVEKALQLERQRTTQARKLAGQLEKVVKQKERADRALKKPAPVQQPRQGSLFKFWNEGRSGLQASKGGVGGLIDLAAGGGSTMALGFGAAAMGITAALAGIAAAAYGAAKAFTAMSGAAMDASKWALEGLQFRENTLATFKVLLGDDGQARDVFSSAMTMAGKTPFSAQTVAQSYQKLLVGGFDKSELSTVFQALGDVAAQNGMDENRITGTADVLAQILAKGKFVTEEKKQLVNQSGIKTDVLYEEIAKNVGIAVGQVEEALSRGDVSADAGINAFLKAIQRQGGGRVGNLVQAQGKTFGGLLSTLKDSPMQLLYDMAESGLPGFNAFKGTLENLVALFQVGTETGKAFQTEVLGKLDGLWTQIFGEFTGPEGQGRLKGIILTAIDTIAEAFKYFQVGVEGVKGAALGFVEALGLGGREMDAAAWKKLGEDAAAAGRLIGEALGGIVSKLVQAANYLAESPNARKAAEGAALFTNPVTAPIGFGKIASAGFGALKDKVGKWWDGLGKGGGSVGTYYEGMVDAFAEGGVVNTPTRALVGEDGPEAIVPLKPSSGEGLSALRGMGGGSGVTVHVNLSVDARGNSSGEAIAEEIARVLPSALIDALEGAALEMGGVF
jgi:tape measure domain-containing protein